MKTQSILTLGLFTLFMGSAQASEMPGKALFDDADCMQCHAAKPFQPNKTNTYPKLVKAVAFCNNNLNTGWFDDEVELVAEYMNKEYYNLKK